MWSQAGRRVPGGTLPLLMVRCQADPRDHQTCTSTLSISNWRVQGFAFAVKGLRVSDSKPWASAT